MEPKRYSRVRLYDSVVPRTTGQSGEYTRNPDGELLKIEREFCARWTTHYDRRGRGCAAREAGYNPSRAHLITRQLLEDPRIQRQIAVIEADRLKRLRFDGDEFLAREMMLATASAAELVELWIPPCRHCWGRNNEYQRTHSEFQSALEEWMRLPDKRRSKYQPVSRVRLYDTAVLAYDNDSNKLPFDEMGGDGYDPSQPPNPACPNCYGRGLEDPERGTLPYIKLKDTRELSDAGKILYAGVKQGPRGIEQLLHSQDAARTRLMNMIGKFLELRAAGQVPAAGQSLGIQMGLTGSVADLLTDDPRSLSDAQLNSLLLSHGVVVTDADDDEGGQGAGRAVYRGEAPPTGRVA